MTNQPETNQLFTDQIFLSWRTLVNPEYLSKLEDKSWYQTSVEKDVTLVYQRLTLTCRLSFSSAEASQTLTGRITVNFPQGGGYLILRGGRLMEAQLHFRKQSLVTETYRRQVFTRTTAKATLRVPTDKLGRLHGLSWLACRKTLTSYFHGYRVSRAIGINNPQQYQRQAFGLLSYKAKASTKAPTTLVHNFFNLFRLHYSLKESPAKVTSHHLGSFKLADQTYRLKLEDQAGLIHQHLGKSAASLGSSNRDLRLSYQSPEGVLGLGQTNRSSLTFQAQISQPHLLSQVAGSIDGGFLTYRLLAEIEELTNSETKYYSQALVDVVNQLY